MLGVQTVALGSLGLALGAPDFALIMYRVLSTQRGREIVMDLIDKALEGKDIMDTMEDLRRTGLFKTNEEQVTEVPQTTERQQVTEVSQVTEEQQATTEVPQTTEGQQVTEDYSNTSLHLAAEQGNLNAVKYFVEKGADVNAKNERGMAPLHLAAGSGYLNVVKYLIERGVDVNAKSDYDATPLHLAARTGGLDVTKYLIGRGADLNAQNDYGVAPLHLAARIGGLDVVKYLVEKGADPYVKDNGGETPLHYAAEDGELDIVKYLVERGADLMAKDEKGETPLHEAQCNLDVVAYLIEKGAGLNAKDKRGMTPLHHAVRCSSYNSLDTIKYLIEKGADLNAKDNDGKTPLHYSADDFYRNLNAVKYLIDGGANINAKDNNGETPLHLAASTTVNLDIVKYLVEKGADLNARNNHNQTPLNKARSWVAKFLSEEQSKQVHQRSRRDISSNSWTNNSIVNWVKGLISSTGSPALLTSRGHDSTTVTAVPEINTAVVNNTIMLGILTAGLFNKTQYKQPIHENLLSPREQSMRLNNIDDKGEATSGTSKPSSWINDLCGWVKEKSEVVVSNVVNGLYGGTAKELKGYKSGNIQTGSKKSEKTSSATLLNVSYSGKSPVQGISKENVSNKGWSSSRRKVEGSTNFGAALPKGASSTASSISQVYAQPDITGLMLLVPIFMNTMGRKFVLPLLSADQPISPEKAHAYASNITNGFKEVLEQQAALKNGIGVHRFKIDFMKMQEEITGKIIGGKFNEISGILKSYAEKACPSREAGCSGRLSQKKFDKFMAEFNRRIDPAINQLMQKMLSKSEVSDVKEQQIGLKPKSYLNGTSVQGHLTQDRDLKNQGKVLIP